MSRGNYKPNIEQFYHTSTIELEKYTSSFVGGHGADINDGIEVVNFPYIAGMNASKHKLIIVKGDSMSPKIEEGDTVIIEVFKNGAKPRQGDIVAVILNGDLILKVYDPGALCLYLSSLNQNYDPIQVYETDSCNILGKAWKIVKDAEL